MKACQYLPENRFSSPEEFYDALETVLYKAKTGGTVTEDPADPPEEVIVTPAIDPVQTTGDETMGVGFSGMFSLIDEEDEKVGFPEEPIECPLHEKKTDVSNLGNGTAKLVFKTSGMISHERIRIDLYERESGKLCQEIGYRKNAPSVIKNIESGDYKLELMCFYNDGRRNYWNKEASIDMIIESGKKYNLTLKHGEIACEDGNAVHSPSDKGRKRGIEKRPLNIAECPLPGDESIGNSWSGSPLPDEPIIKPAVKSPVRPEPKSIPEKKTAEKKAVDKKEDIIAIKK